MKFTKEQCLSKGRQLELENIEDWPKCVDSRFSDIYEGSDCSAFLELVEMQALLNHSIEDIKQALHNQNHSGCSYTMVKSMATHFYPTILPAFD